MFKPWQEQAFCGGVFDTTGFSVVFTSLCGNFIRDEVDEVG